jgi:hypothetical protein
MDFTAPDFHLGDPGQLLSLLPGSRQRNNVSSFQQVSVRSRRLSRPTTGTRPGFA